DRSEREQISEGSPRGVGVDERPEILRGGIIAYEEHPAGTPEHEQRDDRHETRSASDSERRARGESPDIHALPTLPWGGARGQIRRAAFAVCFHGARQAARGYRSGRYRSMLPTIGRTRRVAWQPSTAPMG